MNGHGPRKRRTRQHVIADLGVNHLERFVLLCGHTRVPTHTSDYGIDLILWPHRANGEAVHGEVKFQVKATDGLGVLADGGTISFTVETRDLNFWLGERAPVILVVNDAQKDRGYWLDVKAYAREYGWTVDGFATQMVTLRITMANRVSVRGVRQICRLIPGIGDLE